VSFGQEEERLIDDLTILPFLCGVYDSQPRTVVRNENLMVMTIVQTLLDHDLPWLEQMMGHIQLRPAEEEGVMGSSYNVQSLCVVP
jgi:hypothetical protein